MKYILKRDGKEIEAAPEIWTWGVIYKDGAELHQFEDGPECGTFHQFQEIKQDEVEMFVMIKTGAPWKRIDMVVEGKQIFHFYRNIILSAATSEERRIKIYCFGWKNKNGETAYHFILPDDRIVISDKDLDLTKFNI